MSGQAMPLKSYLSIETLQNKTYVADHKTWQILNLLHTEHQGEK